MRARIPECMIFAFANPKGGVGKSTLSVHLTTWLFERGHKVILVDADVQASSSIWLGEVDPEIPQERLVTPDELIEGVRRLSTEYDLIVIDGPAGLSELTRCILLVSDFALLPCAPSVMDLRAAYDAIRVVRQVQVIRHGPPESMLIPNGLKKRQRLTKDFVETAQTLDIRCSSGIRDLQAYADAVGQGTVVWKMGPAAKEAAKEIHQLFEEITTNVIDNEEINEPRVENG